MNTYTYRMRTRCATALLGALVSTFAYSDNEPSTGYADGSEQVKATASFGQPPSADAPYRNPALDVRRASTISCRA